MRIYFLTLVFWGAVCTISCTKREKLNHPNPKEFAELYPEALESGFAWPQVVSPNDKIDFFISTQNESPQLLISRFKTENLDNNKIIKKIKFNPIPENSIHSCSVAKGCLWKSNLNLMIGEDWEPGLYIARFLDSKNQKKNIYFFVKNEKRGTEFLFLFDWTTLNAYNFYGGQNFYVRLQGGKLYQTAAFKENISGTYSLKRPMFPKNHTYFLDSEEHLAELDDELKLKFLGTDPLEVLYELGKRGQVLPNEFSFLKNDIDLSKYEVIILSAFQEYLSLEFLNRLWGYVKNGGRLIIMANEFAFRRIRSTQDAISYYPSPSFDPLFQTDKTKIASDFPSQIVIRDYFGHALEHGISFGFKSKGREFQLFESDHPLSQSFKDDMSKLRTGWMPGVKMKKGPNGKHCVETKAFSCDDQIVLGSYVYKNKNKNKKTCCRNQLAFDELLDGRQDKVSKSVSETLYMPVYYAKYGKGHLFVAPEAYFFRPDAFAKFYTEFIKFDLKRVKAIEPSI